MGTEGTNTELENQIIKNKKSPQKTARQSDASSISSRVQSDSVAGPPFPALINTPPVPNLPSSKSKSEQSIPTQPSQSLLHYHEHKHGRLLQSELELWRRPISGVGGGALLRPPGL